VDIQTCSVNVLALTVFVLLRRHCLLATPHPRTTHLARSPKKAAGLSPDQQAVKRSRVHHVDSCKECGHTAPRHAGWCSQWPRRTSANTQEAAGSGSSSGSGAGSGALNTGRGSSGSGGSGTRCTGVGVSSARKKAGLAALRRAEAAGSGGSGGGAGKTDPASTSTSSTRPAFSFVSLLTGGGGGGGSVAETDIADTADDGVGEALPAAACAEVAAPPALLSLSSLDLVTWNVACDEPQASISSVSAPTRHHDALTRGATPRGAM
jgi:hypothetical protein